MRIKFLLLSLLVLGTANMEAQQIKQLTLEEAVNLAIQNSDASKIVDTKVANAESQLNVTKNLQYPDVDISGQYRYLTGADVKLRTQTSDSAGGVQTAQPNVNSLLLGQANVSMPIFSGFKLKNTIKAGENQYKAAQFNAKNEKEQIALQTIQNYLNLYKANKTIELIEENMKSAKQRVTDFSNMEENGLLARNDLLKAKLQQSNIEISLEEAKKNERILNYTLAVTLKLPENTVIETIDTDFGNVSGLISSEIARNDLQALQFQEEAAKDQIKVAKSAYYPSLALVGGYIALDLNNALTVTNAMNIGVGVSYNLSNIFKTKSDVKLAKSKVQEMEYTVSMISDKIKVQVENAKQEYELSQKKFEVYTQSEEQAIENYRIVKDKYDNGLSDTNDLLEADVQQLQSKIDLAYSQANINQKYYELLTAKGVLTNQFNQQ
ncbi:TolC family protein [Aequorivita sp. CIP111184]|uniref:TolC family protein n=1 Tax=Aequorivita sp. CIP111184 TaxID=2211356 RepID=UPI000DBC154B|nr:TolC family protein [Aequorivita sp. CIP111184]SRX55742.1 Outer membrane efflux protein BepC [Aequorivita sp. CIP111184]